MKKIAIIVVTTLLTGLAFGACDLEEATTRELYDVEIQETQDGLRLIDGDAEDFFFSKGEVEFDEPLSRPMDISSAAGQEPDAYKMCCDVCIPVCCNGQIKCFGCVPCSIKRPTESPGPVGP